MTVKKRRVLFAVSGWYGMGHLEPILPLAEELVGRHDLEVSLLTTRFELERLQRHQSLNIFDRHFLLEELRTPTGLDDYLRCSNPVNRLRLAHAVQETDPSVVVFHWSLLLPIADRVTLAGRCTVAVMERNEWGAITLGGDDEYGAIDKVIYADEWEVDEGATVIDDHRVCVGPLARPPTGHRLKRREGPIVFVGGGGGARIGNRRLLASVPELALLVDTWTFDVVVGPMTPQPLAKDLVAASAALPNLRVHLDPERGVIESLIDDASLALNNGGIGSTGECLVRGLPFVALDPAGDDGENDRVRVRQLERSGWCRLVDSSPTSPLAVALAAALADIDRLPRLPAVASGVPAAASAIASWADDPQPEVVTALHRIILVVPAAASPALERSVVRQLAGPEKRVLVVRLPADGPSTIEEQARLQRAVLVGGSFESVRVIGLLAEPEDRARFESLECPAPILVVDCSDIESEHIGDWIRPMLAATRQTALPVVESFEVLVDSDFNPFETER